MSPLPLHEFHAGLDARFLAVNDAEAVADYGDPAAELPALRTAAGVIDLSFRGRLCLTGTDRIRLLHGQVTNDIQALTPGSGCYAALVTAKGRMQSDLNVHVLASEVLLDFEPGLTAALAARFDHYIVADDVQVIDVAPHYGLLSIQGPRAANVLERLELGVALPARPFASMHCADPNLGDLYVMNLPRTGGVGFDFFVPLAALGMVADRLILAARQVGGRAVGFAALELARFEAGIPRFGIDMDETNLPPEAGLDARAISYSKGCYIGQEVIARLRTYGQVAKALRGLRLPDGLAALPVKGDKLFRDGRDVGYITSAAASPSFGANLALGYVRRECNTPGTTLVLRSASGEHPVVVVELPFR